MGMRRETMEGVAGWGVVAVVAAGVDVWALRGAHTTLSSAHGRLCASRRGRLALGLAEVILLCHLWHWPKAARALDPFGWAARWLSKGRAER